MTQLKLFQTAISSRRDTPANPSASRGSAKEQKTTATSGRTSQKLLHKKDPLGVFSKMFMATCQWASTKCSLTWKPKVTPQGRILFQLSPLMPPTKEIASGSSPETWPTPTATDGKGSGQNETMRDRLDYAVEKPNGQRISGSLNPTWVEWLMGYPSGWTDLEGLETQSSHTSQSKSEPQ